MTTHVHEDLLTRFVTGDLEDAVGVAVAEHLDACPRCAARAAVLEPLTHAFAAVEDPRLPVGLADAIIAADRAPALPPAPAAMPTPSTAAVLLPAGVLVALAGLLLVAGGSPAAAAAEAAVTVRAILVALGTVELALTTTTLGMAFTAMAAAAWMARRTGALPRWA